MPDLKLLRIATTFLGVVVSWYSTITSFINFYQVEGTIFKIIDCAVPNPITTPCFWGAVAFLVVFIWSLKLYVDNKNSNQILYFLVFCVLFGWSSFYIENWTTILQRNGIVAPCPVGKSPFLSACFFGSVLFTISLLLTFVSIRANKREI
jgi:hypothetical protein